MRTTTVARRLTDNVQRYHICLWPNFAATASTFERLLIYFFIVLPSCNLAQTVQLHYSGRNEKIIAVVIEANKLLLDSEFYKRIDTVQRFDNSTYSGLQVSNEIKALRRIIEVEDYWNPFGIANAKTVSIVRLNTAKLGRDYASITNTVIHETIHAVDWWTNNNWDYTHNDNSPEGQDNTAPWVIGSIAESLVQR